VTLTPLSRSKDQRSTCRGRGHIVAASRTVIGVVTMSSTHTHFSYLFKYWRSAVNPQLQAALTFCMLGWPRAVVAGIGHILYEAYWPRPHFWRNGRAVDESLGHPLAPQLLGSCTDEVESRHVVVVGGLASRRLVGASQLRSTPGNHVPFNCSITDVPSRSQRLISRYQLLLLRLLRR